MKGYINVQSTLFGDFSSFNIDSKSVYLLMQGLAEYEVIPNVRDGVQIKIEENQPVRSEVKQLFLESLKEKLVVEITNDKITILAMPEIDLKNNNKSGINIEKFIENTKKLFGIIYNIIKIKGNRISLVSSYLDEDNVEGYNKYINTSGFFKDRNLIEWNNRAAIRDRLKEINNEEVNIIYNISKAMGVINSKLTKPNNYKFSGILKDIDINTIIENRENRIDIDYINNFYDIAISKSSEIKGEVKCGE